MQTTTNTYISTSNILGNTRYFANIPPVFPKYNIQEIFQKPSKMLPFSFCPEFESSKCVPMKANVLQWRYQALSLILLENTEIHSPKYLGNNPETIFANILGLYPVGIYLFKVNNRNTRTRSKICSHVHNWCRFGVFIVNFEHISHLVLVFPLLTLSS